MSEMRSSNPAVVGLGGFGMTTLILQFHNLGWCGIGPVLWIGLVFGGAAQLIAGMLEFRTGNNFGFCAFSGYGAFWIALCFYVIFGQNAELAKMYPFLKVTPKDLGLFLLMWTLFTGILFLASLKHHTGLIMIFLTLFLGFMGLTVKELSGNQLIGILAYWILILCALSAWYNMARILFADVNIHLPVGGPWIK